jgi:hypothetical protein
VRDIGEPEEIGSMDSEVLRAELGRVDKMECREATDRFFFVGAWGVSVFLLDRVS